jgi:hypothetical protein
MSLEETLSGVNEIKGLADSISHFFNEQTKNQPYAKGERWDNLPLT